MDAVRVAAWEEILAEITQDAVAARLHADMAPVPPRLCPVKSLEVADDKQKAKAATQKADLGPMRCQGRRYRHFEPDRR